MTRERTEPAGFTSDSPAPKLIPFRDDDVADCPCGGQMTVRTGLTYEARNRAGLVLVANLRGLVCGSCGARGWDPPTYETIQSALRSEAPGFGVRAKVSQLSRDNLGAYLPKELRRYMGLQPGDSLLMQPLSQRLLLVEVEPRDEGASA